MSNIKQSKKLFRNTAGILVLLILFVCCNRARGGLIDDIGKLQKAYPSHIIAVSEKSITWQDGTVMEVGDYDPSESTEGKMENTSLADQIVGVSYPRGCIDLPEYFSKRQDPGRIRYEPFFQKMYGTSKDDVEKNLVLIDWMPDVFKDASGKPKYCLQVTRVNGVDQKLKRISEELQQLPPAFYPYLDNPAGTFNWRFIANTKRMSSHSFGMAIDINVHNSRYWQYDLKREKRPVDESASLEYYQNKLPCEIVEIFERHGFIWGGKWYHYDTMHFEYRPELLWDAS
ncbi:M15 family peptidase [Rickettsiales endosymbiont of Peranema trichophorum]|uniref:M15 family metallopeptidase n=1 Tax=Rickettsiales endosymbiont of Peranema trichophorum TaxID=2486577 RepID=UPI001023AA9C|nr:M15 family metallopeptidase [Rickettsiales endosymbiont of Peranema trichophorum]RZI45553.1 M15 family peptidase [Rickettsiales endosymbiont of Peranema trichophorum]